MRDCSKWTWRLASILAVAVMVSGCVGNTAGEMALSADVFGRSSYFVERHQDDSRNLAATIAEKMRERGLQATSGTAGDKKPDLRIEVRDARDQSIVGFGQSSQSSWKSMGKTHEDVIDAALTELFGSR